MNRVILTATALMALAIAAPAHAAGDAAAGKALFARCAICHSTVNGKNMIGPSLFGVVGRKSATEPGYTYSAALKKLDVTWDEATLNKWITNPRAMAPGTKMIFPGLSKDEDRANIIAYLETLK